MSEFKLTELQEKWLAALESGEYKQGIGCLGTPESGLCCLGVLCVVAGINFDDGAFFPSYEVRDAALLRSNTGETSKRFMLHGVECNSLPDANDNAKASFAEIAAAIRANPENFFIT
jgi:hypothetical protein